MPSRKTLTTLTALALAAMALPALAQTARYDIPAGSL